MAQEKVLLAEKSQKIGVLAAKREVNQQEEEMTVLKCLQNETLKRIMMMLI